MSEILYDEQDPRAAFRAFLYDPQVERNCLRAIASDYHWKPGINEADKEPDYFPNSHGFYSYKSLPEAIYQFGWDEEYIFALIAISGTIVEGETGSRSQFAEIVSIIEPGRPEAEEIFDSSAAREAIERDYPGVPIIHRSEIKWKLIEFGLLAQPRTQPDAYMQWIGPNGELVWAPEGMGPGRLDPARVDYEMLDAASTYPDATHPLDLRLRKVSFEADSGETYVFWSLPEEAQEDQEDLPHGFSEAFNVVSLAPKHMYRHKKEAS